jgi:hypothetical protein
MLTEDGLGMLTEDGLGMLTEDGLGMFTVEDGLGIIGLTTCELTTAITKHLNIYAYIQ